MKKTKNSVQRAVIYARYSCSNQTEQSIEGQLADCEKFAEKYNYYIVDTYIDRAMSATTDRRPQFQQMIADSATGGFDVIIVWKLDRFARNRYDSAVNKQKLNSNGVKVVSVMEHIEDTPEGALMESVLEGFAEYFSKDLSQKVSRGMRETALKFKATGLIPYGYKKTSDNICVPDEHTAPVVKKIFEMYADGVINKDICDWLNSHGYRTSNGNLFRNQYLRKILNRRRYTGSYTYGDLELHDENQRIISDELFDRVQIQLQAKKRTGRIAREQYILVGKLFCGYCRNPIRGESGRNHQNRIYTYYKCSVNKTGGKCPKTTVQRDIIENNTIKFILNNFLNDEIINSVVDTIQASETAENNSAELITLRTQIEDTDRKINNLLTAIENGVFTPSTKQRLNDLENVKEKLKYELIVKQSEKNNFNATAFKRFLKNIDVDDFKTTEQRQKLINLVLYREYLWNDKVLYIFNLTPSKPNDSVDIDSYVDALLASTGSTSPTDGVPQVAISELLFGYFFVMGFFPFHKHFALSCFALYIYR